MRFCLAPFIWLSESTDHQQLRSPDDHFEQLNREIEKEGRRLCIRLPTRTACHFGMGRAKYRSHPTGLPTGQANRKSSPKARNCKKCSRWLKRLLRLTVPSCSKVKPAQAKK